MVLGILLIGIGYLIEGTFPVLAIVFAAQVFYGLGATLMDGADAAWIADEVGIEKAGSLYLRAAQVGSIASLLGIALSAVLVNVRLNLPLVVGASLFIALSIVLMLVMPERNFTPAPRENRSTLQQVGHTLRLSVHLMRLRPVILTILGVAVLMGAFSAGFDQLWNYYLLHDFTFPALAGLTSVTWFSIIEAGIVVTNFCGTSIATRYVDTNKYRTVVTALFVVDSIAVISLLGFVLARQFTVALVAFFLFTTVGGPRRSLEQVWINYNLDARIRATMLSLRGQVNAIAQIVGGPLLGLIATKVSIRTTLLVAGSILSCTLFLYIRTLRNNKPPQALSESETTSAPPHQ